MAIVEMEDWWASRPAEEHPEWCRALKDGPPLPDALTLAVPDEHGFTGDEPWLDPWYDTDGSHTRERAVPRGPFLRFLIGRCKQE